MRQLVVCCHLSTVKSKARERQHQSIIISKEIFQSRALNNVLANIEIRQATPYVFIMALRAMIIIKN